jgi:hypothetical protein
MAARRTPAPARRTAAPARLRPHITVRVGRIPGKIEDVVLNGERTVETALRAVGINWDDAEIRVNDTVAELETELKNGDHVLVAEDIQGN